MRFVIDGMVCAQRDAGCTLFVAAGGGNDCAAHSLGKLYCSDPNAAGSALHQKSLAFLQSRTIKYVAPDRKKSLGQRSCFSISQTPGHRQALANRCDAVFGIPAPRH